MHPRHVEVFFYDLKGKALELKMLSSDKWLTSYWFSKAETGAQINTVKYISLISLRPGDFMVHNIED